VLLEECPGLPALHPDVISAEYLNNPQRTAA
jgi:hypothetical protein